MTLVTGVVFMMQSAGLSPVECKSAPCPKCSAFSAVRSPTPLPHYDRCSRYSQAKEQRGGWASHPNMVGMGGSRNGG